MLNECKGQFSMPFNIACSVNHQGLESLKHINFFPDPSSLRGISSLRKQFESVEQEIESYKVGFIGDESFFSDLGTCFNLLPLLENSWEKVVKWGEIDFIIIQSCYQTLFGDWLFYQSSNSKANAEINKLLSHCSSRDIPIVYIDNQCDELSKNFIIEQDLENIFSMGCSKAKSSESFRKKVSTLDVFFDIKKFNPFAIRNSFENEGDNEKKLTFIFERFCILDSNDILVSCFDSLEKFLDIELIFVERRMTVYDSRARQIPFYEKMKGCLTPNTRVQAFNGMDVWFDYLDSEDNFNEISKRAIEAAGCQVFPIVFDPHDYISDEMPYAQVVKSLDELLVFTQSIKLDRVYLDRLRHLAWREAVTKHSVIDVFNKLLRNVGLEGLSNSLCDSKAAVIVPTIRSENLNSVIETFDNFSYENKELVIITHGFSAPQDIVKIIDDRLDVKLRSMPKSATLGDCLNFGVTVSDADIVMRMDDDDYYGSNYIVDIVRQLYVSDSSFLVKPRAPILFNDSDELLVRPNSPSMVYCTEDDLKEYRLKFGGNSFSGKKEFFLRNKFSNDNYGACDTATLRSLRCTEEYSFCIGDHFNLIAVRSSDTSLHTWKINKKDLLKNSLVYNGSVDDFFI